MENPRYVEGRRVVTGVPHLDDILAGGLIQGNVYLVTGPPGSGKTILGSQIGFHNVRQPGCRSLYITLLAETHQTLVAHLSSLAFFDRAAISETFHFRSGYPALRVGGIHGNLGSRDHGASPGGSPLQLGAERRP